LCFLFFFLFFFLFSFFPPTPPPHTRVCVCECSSQTLAWRSKKLCAQRMPVICDIQSHPPACLPASLLPPSSLPPSSPSHSPSPFHLPSLSLAIALFTLHSTAAYTSRLRPHALVG
jgi:hypothetical protein